jgi:DNA-binding response OmpR family regulator
VTILVVEDEQSMAALLKQGLTEEGHHVCVARDGIEGLEIAQSSSFDVVILDLMLPRLDGLSVTRRLRESSNKVPILMLTAKDSIPDVVKGLDTGADDYLTKPFSFEVLLARLRAVSRRGPIPSPVLLKLADLSLNTATREVTRGGQQISLTPKEYNLLEFLLRHAGRPVSRNAILDSVWGFDSEVGENNLEAYVRLLRNKIDFTEPKLIVTVRGVGYCMRSPAP